MQTFSQTFEVTYTRADIKRVISEIAADLDMIAEASGALTRDDVDNYVADLSALAQEEYIDEVHVSLHNRLGGEVRATGFKFSTSASSWQSQMPGNNLWPYTPGGTIKIGVSFTAKFRELSSGKLAAFLAGLRVGIGSGTMDFSHPGLISSFDRRYASRGFGAEKTNFA
jgi:hypothetical protein